MPRMILQNVIFPSIATCTEEHMYFRRSGNAVYKWAMDHIMVGKNSLVEFDTYFNGFSAEKWMKYTNVGKVFLSITLSGELYVTLMRKEKTGKEIHVEYCGEYLCKTKTDEIKEFIFEYDTFSSFGMFCFNISSIRGKSRLYKAAYFTELPEDRIQSVKLAIDICTYKRERFVAENLKLLKERYLDNRESLLYDKLEVFVSDNAGTLDDTALADEKIHIFKNKNAGGAGGFTRGMIEIYKVRQQKGITHILLMDDDVRIEPESIYRTCTLLMCLKDRYKQSFVGGAMLRLDRQNIQVESGASWNAGDLVSLKQGLDLNLLKSCLLNELEEGAQFNAWWYCVFPIDVITDDNLPMPIFIRGDDVEFGLRNMKHLILMNGICIWHEPFENKYSSFLYYYLLRNRLIDNAIHHMSAPKEQFIVIMNRWVGDEIRLYRYKNADLLMDGIEDFLRGVDWLSQQDGEELHKEVMGKGYKMENMEDLENLEDGIAFSYPLYEASLAAKPKTSLKDRVINHYTLNGTFLSPTCRYNIVPVMNPCQSSVYRTDVILNYDYASRKGFVTRRDPEKARECMSRLKKLGAQLSLKYDRAVQDYEDNYRKLTNMEFWRKYLGIS